MAVIVLDPGANESDTGTFSDIIFVFSQSGGLSDTTATSATALYQYSPDGSAETIDYEVKLTGTGFDTDDSHVTTLQLTVNDAPWITIYNLDLDFGKLADALELSGTAMTDAIGACLEGVSQTANFSESSGDNLILGLGGDDFLRFGSGSDTFYADGGADYVEMGAGADSLYCGNPFEFSAAGQSRIDGGKDEDTVYLQSDVGNQFFTKGQTISLAGTITLKLSGYTLSLASFENVVGTGFADKLTGSKGSNYIVGADGGDQITGGGGADRLAGGDGKDTFLYLTAKDSGVGVGKHDTIYDFTQGDDRIDLSALSPETKTEAFKFVGDGKLRAAGDLHFVQHDAPDPVDGPPGVDYTLVQANIDGKGGPDIEIYLSGLIDLTKADFLL